MLCSVSMPCMHLIALGRAKQDITRKGGSALQFTTPGGKGSANQASKSAHSGWQPVAGKVYIGY